jgi:hypothetical protein
MQLVVRWKVLVNKTKEITPYISADTHAEWWVEPNDVSMLRCLFLRACYWTALKDNKKILISIGKY